MNLVPAPSFCSLEGRQLQDRLVWIADLNRQWLRRKQLNGRTLTLVYDSNASDALDTLVARERQCCAVLQFDLTRSETELKLAVTAPPSTGVDIEAQLAAFGQVEPMTDTTCCGSCEPSVKTATAGRVAGVAATASVAAALACGACCVLPIAIPAIATGMSGVVVAWLAGSAAWMTLLAVALVAMSWAWLGWRSIKAKARPSPSTWALMSVATAAAGIAVLWPHLEPSIFMMLRLHE